MKIYSVIALAVVISSCGKDKKVAYTNDMEQSIGWVNHHTLKGEPNAHSGGYVSFTDSAQVYSLTLREKISVVKSSGASKIFASAWVNPRSLAAKGSLIVSVDANNKNYMWLTLSMDGIAKEPGKWAQLAFTGELKGDLPEEAMLSVFFWNTSKEDIMVDDLEVRLEK
jgi:hypothetical protein